MSAGKLVRDQVPQAISSQGLAPSVREAGPSEYTSLLRAKLTEETAEFLMAASLGTAGPALTELADVLEVVYALAKDLGYSANDLDRARARKAAEWGRFDRRLVWSGNVDPNA